MIGRCNNGKGAMKDESGWAGQLYLACNFRLAEKDIKCDSQGFA